MLSNGDEKENTSWGPEIDETYRKKNILTNLFIHLFKHNA